ncbi:helix-turn-helix domain-containing protein [Actinomadura sp. B10D3]|uniref:helix-turn-helix domain-containing protein n=1 Tax=Actinomadura sp. B10D3 TaxID=3153557 RepID=UPI00325F5BFA
MLISDPSALAEVAAKLWRNGLPAVEEDLARAGGPVADALRRALARAAHLLSRAESERELRDALILRLTGVPELASMVEAFRAMSPGPGLRSRWPMSDQPAPGLARVLDGREGDARWCAWSPDGHWLVSISSGFSSDRRNAVRLWNARTWRPGPTFDHGADGSNWIYDCVLPSSGEWLATYAAGTVWIRDMDSMLAVFAEFEADLLKMRTREGMAIARSRGKLKGRQPKLTARQQAELARMHATGDYTIAELMEVFSIGRATVYRVLDRTKTTGTTGAETPR